MGWPGVGEPGRTAGSEAGLGAAGGGVGIEGAGGFATVGAAAGGVAGFATGATGAAAGAAGGALGAAGLGAGATAAGARTAGAWGAGGAGAAAGLTVTGCWGATTGAGAGGFTGAGAGLAASGAGAAAGASGSGVPCSFRRTFSATSTGMELEWVFFSVTPKPGSRSIIAFALTSSSRANSLIRTWVESLILLKNFSLPAEVRELCVPMLQLPRSVSPRGISLLVELLRFRLRRRFPFP